MKNDPETSGVPLRHLIGGFLLVAFIIGLCAMVQFDKRKRGSHPVSIPLPVTVHVEKPIMPLTADSPNYWRSPEADKMQREFKDRIFAEMERKRQVDLDRWQAQENVKRMEEAAARMENAAKAIENSRLRNNQPSATYSPLYTPIYHDRKQTIFQSIPGTNIPDYHAPSATAIESGDRTIIRRNIPGTTVPDYSSSSIIIESE